jgi:SAM-dependent methyltransferase
MPDKTSIARRSLKSLPGYRILRRIHRSLLGTSEEHWARVVMNHETRKIISSLSPGNLETLEISGSGWGEKMPFRSYKSVHYPDFDICESSLEETFDLIIAEQVFEHLLWPYRAGKNVYKMLNPDGHFLVTTPFLIRVHNSPTDCSRWTETGIKFFLAECGFSMERIRAGSWGNRACVRANFSHWASYRRWFHSLKNEPDFPVVVWALAQK